MVLHWAQQSMNVNAQRQCVFLPSPSIAFLRATASSLASKPDFGWMVPLSPFWRAAQHFLKNATQGDLSQWETALGGPTLVVKEDGESTRLSKSSCKNYQWLLWQCCTSFYKSWQKNEPNSTSMAYPQRRHGENWRLLCRQTQGKV